MGVVYYLFFHDVKSAEFNNCTHQHSFLTKFIDAVVNFLFQIHRKFGQENYFSNICCQRLIKTFIFCFKYFKEPRLNFNQIFIMLDDTLNINILIIKNGF